MNLSFTSVIFYAILESAFRDTFLPRPTLDVNTKLQFRCVASRHSPSSGQEEYERLRPLSYSKSHVILIAFAIDTPDSLENVSTKWNEEVRSICGPSVPILLVGLKSDLRPPPDHPDIRNYVSRERAEEVAQEIGARAYKECSALKIQGVDDVFEAATRASLLVRDGERDKGERAAEKARRGKDGLSGRKEGGGCCVVC